MAVVQVRSNLITNTMASPRVQNPATYEFGRRRAFCAGAAVGSADSIGSTYRLMRVGSHWRCVSLVLRCTAITSASMKLGYYVNEDIAGAGASTLPVAGADAVYASSQSIATAITAGTTDLAYGVKTADKYAQLVWQDAGLSSAPQPTAMYDLTATLTAAATAAGTIFIEGVFVVD